MTGEQRDDERRTALRAAVERFRVRQTPWMQAYPAKALAWQFDGLGGDELDVIGLLVERVRDKGVPAYGHLDVESDTRDMDAETRDEVLDGLWYAGCALLRLRRGDSDDAD